MPDLPQPFKDLAQQMIAVGAETQAIREQLRRAHAKIIGMEKPVFDGYFPNGQDGEYIAAIVCSWVELTLLQHEIAQHLAAMKDRLAAQAT